MNNANNRRKTDNNANNLNNDVEMGGIDEPYQRRHSDKINTNTFINLDGAKPLGIDMNNFMDCFDHTVHSISQTNDLPIISEVNEQHQSFKGIVNKRLNSLKMISGWWINSDYSSAFNAINLMKDLSVTNDFFSYAFVRNDINKIPLTLDNALTILPHVIQLLNSKYEVYIKCGVRTAANILKCFNERITTVKSVVLGSGVDLAREERLNKCDSIIEMYEKILLIQSIKKIISKHNNDDVKYLISLKAF